MRRYFGDTAVLARKDLRLELRARDTLPAMLRNIPLRDDLGKRIGTVLLFRSSEELDAIPHGDSIEGLGLGGSNELTERLGKIAQARSEACAEIQNLCGHPVNSLTRDILAKRIMSSAESSETVIAFSARFKYAIVIPSSSRSSSLKAAASFALASAACVASLIAAGSF